MATSDRGLIDVERFDLEPERPIFHGLLGDVDAARLAGLSSRQRCRTCCGIIDGAEPVATRGGVAGRGRADAVDVAAAGRRRHARRGGRCRGRAPHRPGRTTCRRAGSGSTSAAALDDLSDPSTPDRCLTRRR